MAAQRERTARTDSYVPSHLGQPVEMRFGWPYVGRKKDTDWEDKPIAPADQAYEITAFIPKTAQAPWDCVNYMAVAGPLLTAAAQQWGQWPFTNAAGQIVYWPIADCDLTQGFPQQLRPGFPNPRPVAPNFFEKNPWAKGHWRLGLSTNRPPLVVGADNNQLAVGGDGNLIGFKGGDYGFVSMAGLTYLPGTMGITCYFEGVKKTRDGEPVAGLGGGQQRSATQMFGGPAPTAPPIPAGAYGSPPAAQVPYVPQTGGYGAPQTPQQGYGAPQVPVAPAYPAQPQQSYGAPPAGFQQGYAPPQAPAAPTAAYPAPPVAAVPYGTVGTGGYATPPSPSSNPPPAYPGAGPVAPPAYGTR